MVAAGTPEAAIADETDRAEFVSDRQSVIRVMRTWANNATAFAKVIARHDASWKTETFELAGGYVVLDGRGMYVNRALAVGLDRVPAYAEYATIEARSSAVGVPTAGKCIRHLSAIGYEKLKLRAAI